MHLRLLLFATLIALASAFFPNVVRKIKENNRRIWRPHYEPHPQPDYIEVVYPSIERDQPVHATVDYSLDSPYYEHDRVYQATCKVHINEQVNDYDVCFMEGYTTLGCYKTRPYRSDPKWEYDSQYYRSTKLRVHESGHNHDHFGISIKGLSKNQPTHCQLNIHSETSVSSVITSNPVELSKEVHPEPEVMFRKDNTVVKIFKHRNMYRHGNIYTCEVHFGDYHQYDEQTTKISFHLRGFACPLGTTRENSPYNRMSASNVIHQGGNVYSAEFETPFDNYECHVQLSDGRTYKSKKL